MNTIARVLLLACWIFLTGCRKDGQVSKEQLPEKEAPSIITVEALATTEKTPEKGELKDSELPEEEAPEKGAPSMIKVESLTAEEKVLALNYQVTNPFPYDIWVCEDIDIQSGCPVDIRIDAETVYIKLTYRLQSNMLRDPPAYGKYRRLLAGEPHSGKIRLDLPITNISPVYYFKERGKSRKHVVLHRALFVIGYLEGGPISRLRERIGTLKRGFDDITLDEVRRTEPIIAEETQDGQSREMLYLTCAGAGGMERCAEVLVTDVNIPCSVVVDDKKRAEQGTIEWR